MSEIQSVFTREAVIQIPEAILVTYLERLQEKFNFSLTAPFVDHCTIFYPRVVLLHINNRSDISAAADGGGGGDDDDANA
jgi:hypothetical protein